MPPPIGGRFRLRDILSSCRACPEIPLHERYGKVSIAATAKAQTIVEEDK
jgi:hypothetical protein